MFGQEKKWFGTCNPYSIIITVKSQFARRSSRPSLMHTNPELINNSENVSIGDITIKLEVCLHQIDKYTNKSRLHYVLHVLKIEKITYL